jgi:hypothetical protein
MVLKLSATGSHVDGSTMGTKQEVVSGIYRQFGHAWAQHVSLMPAAAAVQAVGVGDREAVQRVRDALPDCSEPSIDRSDFMHSFKKTGDHTSQPQFRNNAIARANAIAPLHW